MTKAIRRVMWVIFLCAALPLTTARDSPMRRTGRCTTATSSARGTTRARRRSAGRTPARLVEKWRFPAKGSDRADRGHPRHADRRGRLRLLRHGHRPDVLQADARRQAPLVLPQAGPRGRQRRVVAAADEAAHDFRFQSSAEGIMTSALVTEDTVYFGDIGGWFYALDRADRRGALEARTRGRASSPAPTRSTSSSPRRSSPTAR